MIQFDPDTSTNPLPDLRRETLWVRKLHATGHYPTWATILALCEQAEHALAYAEGLERMQPAVETDPDNDMYHGAREC